jgi:tRNA A37 threonylcarbamoyladenosine dehydratase
VRVSLGDLCRMLSPEAMLMGEQLSRNIKFFGAASQALIGDALVVVVGLGGVGSHCAHLLVRSGVHNIRLIDFDRVTLSSLNRHAVATRADVGLTKVDVLKRRLLEISPSAVIDARPVLFEGKAAEELLEGVFLYMCVCVRVCVCV